MKGIIFIGSIAVILALACGDVFATIDINLFNPSDEVQSNRLALDDGQGCNENLTCQDGNCASVICTFMLDNRVNSVKYNGVPLGISPSSMVTSWNVEKIISFQSCCDNYPGVLEIKGTNSENDYHCNLAGLGLRCTASRSSSPWHNFISDIDHWKVENDATPCEGVYSGRDEIPFIAALKSFGAKKIWNNKKIATLRGSPAFYIPH